MRPVYRLRERFKLSIVLDGFDLIVNRCLLMDTFEEQEYLSLVIMNDCA